jgi:hypothetical protein
VPPPQEQGLNAFVYVKVPSLGDEAKHFSSHFKVVERIQEQMKLDAFFFTYQSVMTCDPAIEACVYLFKDNLDECGKACFYQENILRKKPLNENSNLF